MSTPSHRNAKRKETAENSNNNKKRARTRPEETDADQNRETSNNTEGNIKYNNLFLFKNIF